MGRTIKRAVLWVFAALLVLFAISVVLNWNTIQRVFLGGVKVYETTQPPLPANLQRPAILVFSKTNGFRHEEAIPAANALFSDLARREGWGYFQTENGATFQPDILARFDAVVFNNVSGDVFTAAQRKALQDFLQRGGGFVGIHGSGGDMSYDWKWYVDQLIGAQFIGHPMGPQFQQAIVRIEDAAHPATTGLPKAWQRTDEWYSFEGSPRSKGYHILATLDEKTYSPEGPFGQDLKMGTDHPIAWWHCVGKGRAFYSAMGHQAQAYKEPPHKEMLLGAIKWSLRLDGQGCDATGTTSTNHARQDRP